MKRSDFLLFAMAVFTVTQLATDGWVKLTAALFALCFAFLLVGTLNGEDK